MHVLLSCLLTVLLTACSEPKVQKGIAQVPGGPVLEGTNSSGGGDAYASEFLKIAEEILGRLIWHDRTAVTAKGLQSAIRETEIKSVEAVLYHPTIANNFLHPLCTGQDLNPEPGSDWSRVDAINCPVQKRILFSLVNWKSFSLFEKRRLVLHEYLGILRLADRKYEKSHEILKKLSLKTVVRLSPLTIFGPLAKAIIDSIKWDASQVRNVEEKFFDGSVLRGKLYGLKRGSIEVLHCEEGTVQIKDANISTGQSCAFLDVSGELRDASEISIQDDRENTLWNAFAPSKSDRQFDLKFVRGETPGTVIFRILD
jgi:hypothetical protein